MAISVRKAKKKVARRNVKGLQAPGFEGWEKLEGDWVYPLEGILHDSNNIIFIVNYEDTNDFWQIDFNNLNPNLKIYFKELSE